MISSLPLLGYFRLNDRSQTVWLKYTRTPSGFFSPPSVKWCLFSSHVHKFLRGPKGQCCWYHVLYPDTKYIDSNNSKYIVHNIFIYYVYTLIIMLYLQVTDIFVFIANLNIPTTRFCRFIKAVVSTSLKPSSSPCRSLRRSLTARVFSCFSRTCSTAFDVFENLLQIRLVQFN